MGCSGGFSGDPALAISIRTAGVQITVRTIAETGHNCGAAGSSLQGCKSASILLLLLQQEENTIISIENFE